MKLSRETEMEDTYLLVAKNQEFQYQDEKLKVTSYAISEGQYSNARNKIDKKTFVKKFTTIGLSIETSIEEIKHVVMGDKRG